MKTRVANMLVCRHFDRWVRSIEDEKVRDLVAKNTILTGGAIVTLITENRVNDYDFYFRNRKTCLAVAEYYVRQFKQNPPPRFKAGGEVAIYVDSSDQTEGRIKIVVKSAGVAGEDSAQGQDYAYFEGDGNPENQEAFLDAALKVDEDRKAVEEPKPDRKPFRPVWLSANAISLSDKTQVVIRFHGEPDAIHENYDFVHCTLAWTSWERRIRGSAEAWECILTRELRYVGSRYPVCSIFRVRKFVQRGWTITAGQLLKIMWQVRALDLTNFSVLEDQLTGVDVAYFKQLLDALKDKGKDRVDETYLMELLDRMV